MCYSCIREIHNLQHGVKILSFLSALLYVSKRGAY